MNKEKLSSNELIASEIETKKKDIEDRGFILRENGDGKYNISFDLSRNFSPEELDMLSKFEGMNQLLKVNLLIRSLDIDSISKLSIAIDKVLKKSDWGELSVKKGFLIRIFKDDYDIMSKKKLFNIGSLGEVIDIIGERDAYEVVNFMNKIIELRNILKGYVESRIIKVSKNDREELKKDIMIS